MYYESDSWDENIEQLYHDWGKNDQTIQFEKKLDEINGNKREKTNPYRKPNNCKI